MDSRPLISRNIVLSNFLLVLVVLRFVHGLLAQQTTPKIVLGGEPFAPGMAQQEAIKKLGNCRSITGGSDLRDARVKSYFVWDKDQTDILGTIWFRDEEVEGVEREGAFSQDPEAISFSLSLYRSLSQDAHVGGAPIVLQTGAKEAANASSKFITFIFRDGRSVEMEIVAPDDPQKRSQVSLEETLTKR